MSDARREASDGKLRQRRTGVTRMRAVCAEADVAHEVHGRDHAQSSTCCPRECPRVGPAVDLPVRRRSEEGPVDPPVSPPEKGSRLFALAQVLPSAHLDVGVRPRTPPRSPAPHASLAEEVVRSLTIPLAHQIRPGDHPHSLVIPIPVEQLVAVLEEPQRRDRVILQDDRLVNLAEDPFDGAADRGSATEIPVTLKHLQLAVPRHQPRHLVVHCLACVCLARSGSIDRHKQSMRGGLPNGRQNLADQLWPPPAGDQDGHLGAGSHGCFRSRRASRSWRTRFQVRHGLTVAIWTGRYERPAEVAKLLSTAATA